MRRDLDAGDEIALLHDLAIETGEDLEGVDAVDPLEVRDVDVEDARVRGEQVDPALRRAAAGQAAPADRVSKPRRRFVLVHLTGFEDQDRDRLAKVGVAELGEIVLGQAPALRPALVTDLQVAGEDRTDKSGGRASAGRDPFEAHPFPIVVSGAAAEGCLDRATGVNHGHR